MQMGTMKKNNCSSNGNLKLGRQKPLLDNAAPIGYTETRFFKSVNSIGCTNKIQVNTAAYIAYRYYNFYNYILLLNV